MTIGSLSAASGVSVKAIAQIEVGRTCQSGYDCVGPLADALGVDVLWLTFEQGHGPVGYARAGVPSNEFAKNEIEKRKAANKTRHRIRVREWNLNPILKIKLGAFEKLSPVKSEFRIFAELAKQQEQARHLRIVKAILDGYDRDIIAAAFQVTRGCVDYIATEKARIGREEEAGK